MVFIQLRIAIVHVKKCVNSGILLSNNMVLLIIVVSDLASIMLFPFYRDDNKKICLFILDMISFAEI